MIVFCRQCQEHYDDESAWTLCPHALRPQDPPPIPRVDAVTAAELRAEFNFRVGPK